MLKPITPLSIREQEHFEMLLDGKTQKEIAKKQCVVLDTVKTRIKSILSKYDKPNTTILICDYYKSIIEDLKGENK